MTPASLTLVVALSECGLGNCSHKESSVDVLGFIEPLPFAFTSQDLFLNLLYSREEQASAITYWR